MYGALGYVDVISKYFFSLDYYVYYMEWNNIRVTLRERNTWA